MSSAKRKTKSKKSPTKSPSRKTPKSVIARSFSSKTVKNPPKAKTKRASSKGTTRTRARRMKKDPRPLTMVMRIIMYIVIAHFIGTSVQSYFLTADSYHLADAIIGISDVPLIFLIFGLLDPAIVTSTMSRSRIISTFGVSLLCLYILGIFASSN